MLESPLLRLENLHCERAERLLFGDLSLELHAGEILEITGPNGSGKSTLLRIAAGLTQAFAGAVFWRGDNVDTQRQDFQQQCLYLGHNTGIKPSLTVQENLRFSTRLKSEFNEQRAKRALETVQLNGLERQRCYSLSAGQQRRVALARLLTVDAALWILDEPFTALDKAGVAIIESLCQDHLTNGGAILLATHQSVNVESGLRQLQLGAAA
ncbi:MAG: cytochrome c biogenesis heme-transporting ATPase CcmA [Pseudomonadales bacterium]